MRKPALLTLAAALLVAAPTRADGPRTLDWLPGSSREIARSTSASRDAPVSALVFAPRVRGDAAVDFAFVKLPLRDVALRPGMFFMFDLEHARPGVAGALPMPGQGKGQMLWRGLYGLTFALSAERLARQLLGERGAIEVAITLGHESDHVTGESFEDALPSGGIEHGGGDYGQFDVAARTRLGRFVEVWARAQDRLYVRGHIRHAPGLDLGLRVCAHRFVQPVVGVFGEALLVNRDVSEAEHGFFTSLLAGLAFVGRFGELTPFVAWDAGNGQGLLIDHREVRFGGGVRYAPF
ncbi:hypothetical protein ACMHYB_38200 [Sorangium sp. So ce1128]